MASAAHITRRLFLRQSAVVSTIYAMPTAALAADADAPTLAADAAPNEHPWDAASRLAHELSEVLATDGVAGWGPAGKWYAEVYPTSIRGHDVLFCNIKARNWSRAHVSQPFLQVVDAHKMARSAFEDACRDVDRTAIGREPSKAAWRRWRQAGKVENAALKDLCAFHPDGRADAMAKARYLRKYVASGELTADQIMALAYAGTWSTS